MMTEETNNKNIKVVIDTSATEKRIKEEYEQKLAEKDETIKALLAKEKKEFIKEIEPRPAPTGGETSRLYEPEPLKIDIEGSDIDPSWVKGSNVGEVIEKVNILSKQAANKNEYKRIQSKLLKKMISGNKPLDMTFLGSSKDFLRSELPIRELDSEEIRQQKIDYNNRLKANRTNWRNNSED